MRANVALVLASLVLVGCPGKEVPPAGPPAAPPPLAAAGAVGSLSVLVQDERGRPIEGAVAWVSGHKDTSPVPSTPVVLSQRGLEFQPGLVVARQGQTLVIKNEDAELHMVHGNGPCCNENLASPAGTTQTRRLDTVGEAAIFCDIHAHMRATLIVLDDAFLVSDASGGVSFAALPSGKHKLHVRALGRVRADVDVAAVATSVTVTLPPLPPGPHVVPPEKLPWPTLAVRLRASLDEAVRWAARGDADSARSAADEADGAWYAGSGLKQAIREFDANRGDDAHQARWQQISSQIKRVATKSAAAAALQGEARDKAIAELEKLVENIGSWVSDPAGKLPKREVEK